MFGFLKKKKASVEDSLDSDKYKKAQVTRTYNRLKNYKLEMMREELEDLQRKQEEQYLNFKIEKMRSDLYEDDGEEEEKKDGFDPDMLFAGLITKFLSATPSLPVPAPAPQATPYPQNTGLTDEQMREIKQKIPGTALNQIKQMPDEEIAEYLKTKYPTADDMTIARAIVILRE